MKKSILFLLLFASINTYAQIPDQVSAAADQATTQKGMGSILSELGNGIDPSSFSKSFSLQDFEKSASALKPDDTKGAAGILGNLAAGLKPSAFIKGFNVKEWASRLKSVASMQGLAGEAEKLVKNILPSAFKKGFDVNTITSALGMLKKMK